MQLNIKPVRVIATVKTNLTTLSQFGISISLSFEREIISYTKNKTSFNHVRYKNK